MLIVRLFDQPDLLPDLKRLAAKTELPSGNRDTGRQRNEHCAKNAFQIVFFMVKAILHKSARVCHLHGLFPPFRRRFSATLPGLLATRTIFLNNERRTSKNAVTTFKEIHRNDGLQENYYASKYGVQPMRNGTQ